MLTFWYSLLWPALLLSGANIGKSATGLLFTVLVLFVTAIIQASRLGFAGLRDHLLRFFGLEFVAGVLVWLLFFTAAVERLAYDKWADAETRAAKAGAEVNKLVIERAEIQAQLDDKRHTLQVLEAFRTYRGYLGTDRNCMILVSGPASSTVSRMIGVLIPGVVSGSNCPNGNLLNIGVKPEDEEAENVKGAMPGFVVLHAPSDAKEANYLESTLSNVLPLKRSYTLPRPIQGHMIWLQVGEGTKWNDELWNK